MAIDASIPFRAVQNQMNPLESYANIQQLAAGQLQLKHGQHQAQLQAEQEQDDKTIQSALLQSNGNMGKTIQLTAGKINPQRTAALQKFDTEHKESLLQNAKTQNELEADTNSKLAALVEQAKNLPPDQYAQQYPNIVGQAVKLKPELANHIDPSAPIPQDQLTQLQLGFITQANYHAQATAAQSAAEEARKEALGPSQLASSQADAQLKQANAAAGGSPEQLNARDQLRYTQLAGRQAGGKPISPEDSAFMKGYEKSKTIGPRTTFALQNTPANVAPPFAADAPIADKYKALGGQAGIVKGIVEGRQSPPGSFALKTPYWQGVMQSVYQIDPDWSEQRAQLRKGLTVGPQSKEINAINTAMGHVSVLNDAIDALNNGNLKALNALGNRIGVETGNNAKTVFDTIVHRVGPELSKAYIGAGGSAGERGADEKDFDPSLSPQQLKSNVAISAKLLRSKIGSYENMWEQNKAPGMKSFQEQFISPEAKTALDKLNPQANTQKFSDGGVTYNIPKDQVADFKKDHPNAK